MKIFCQIILIFYIYNFGISASELNSDLYIKLIDGLSNEKWALTGPKQTRPKKYFSRKTKKISHPPLLFNNSIVSETPYQKHLGISLGDQLRFEKHLKVITTKLNKTIGLLLKFFFKNTETGINNYV